MSKSTYKRWMKESYLYEAEDIDDKVVGTREKEDGEKVKVTVKQAMDYSGDDKDMLALKDKAKELKAKGGDKEEPKAEPKQTVISKTGGLGGDTGTDADVQGEPPEGAREPEGGEEPSVEKSRFSGAHMDDVDDSLRNLKQQGKDDIKPPPELERGVAKVIEKIESGTMTDEDLEWAKESYKELRGQAGGNQYLEDMEWDLREALKKHDSEWKAYARTGNELNQETLTIDGKQYRRISESVEKQPKPKYAFSEFYQRFKRQE